MSQTETFADQVVSFAFMFDPEISGQFLAENQDAIKRQAQKGDEPDVLAVPHPQPEGQRGLSSTLIRTTFFPTLGDKNTVQCVIGGELCTFDPGGIKSYWAPEIEARNKEAGFVLPKSLTGKQTHRTPTEHAAIFSFHTSQEMHALNCAQADGKTAKNYQRNEQAGALFHQRAGAPHMIRMELTEGERAAGLALDYLETLAQAQDADAVLATAYILGVLAPPPHLTARPYAGGWIDFDDVLKKINWYPQTTEARREMRAKVWGFIKFGERAQIVGKRIGAKYKDGDGNEIDTTIHGAAWRVMNTETPDTLSFFGALETPVRAEIVVSKELTALLTNPKVAQYFQCAEILGAIAGGKPAGAWARVIGIALMDFWRRNPREHHAGTLKPTRRELLNHLAAKIAPYQHILESTNPERAVDYWCGALQILADTDFIARTGEATITAKKMRAALPRENWQAFWLDQTVDIQVGAKTKHAFEMVLNALPALKTRDLKAKPRNRKALEKQ